MIEFRAGAVSLPLEPPLGLPMVGFVRQPWNARGYGLPLEVGALVLERGDTRVVLCGVDVVGIVHPQIEPLIDRVAGATGADPAGVLLNLSHTHLAPPGGVANGAVYGDVEEEVAASIEAFSRVVHDKIVSACGLAARKLEPAGIVWGQADVDLAVNRRERTMGGYNGGSILGWNPDELVDNQVTVLQARRPDESPIATVVGFGCHPVTTGYDMDVYSADFPGPMRDVVRSVSGGECIFFQGAGGNVLPKFAFTDTEDEARRMGTRLGLAALEAVADRFSREVTVVAEEEGSVTPITRYRRRYAESAEEPALAAARETVSIPLMPHPPLEEIERQRREYDEALEEARASGDRGRVKLAYYHASWARRIEGQLRGGTAPTEVTGPVHAVRIGDGVIVTGPGETFTEYGIAVKERSPGAPTLYAGYTNEILGYLPTANEYQYGGYEAGYGYKSVGLPSLFDPSVERILVETGVRLAERLFPEVEPWDEAEGWLARGEVPRLPEPRLEHPSRVATEVVQ
jgi:neutral ceramidase